MEFVYRYSCKGKPVYIGITNNLRKRVAQHKKDKLSILDSPKIEYFAVESRTDAELMETYLINKYKTYEFLNIKKKKGDVSILGDCEDIDWLLWTGKLSDGLCPYKAGINIVVKEIEKTRYITEPTAAKIIAQYDESIRIIQERMEYDKKLADSLEELLESCGSDETRRRILQKGRDLHRECFKRLEAYLSNKDIESLFCIRSLVQDINNFESKLERGIYEQGNFDGTTDKRPGGSVDAG